mmetsp:Transcript_26210/g.80670  ORF Transcript_26210/g.80670 Transcript_26210/m.80670 type:complete len:220 (-) Transcript_26210:54-713(-)
MDSWKSAFHVPAVKSLSAAQPARMPRPLFGLSEPSSANEIGAWMTVTPASRAFSATCADRSSMPVAAMESLTASWSLPPSVVNSFWYSMSSSAVFEGTMSAPPFASAAPNVRSAESAPEVFDCLWSVSTRSRGAAYRLASRPRHRDRPPDRFYVAAAASCRGRASPRFFVSVTSRPRRRRDFSPRVGTLSKVTRSQWRIFGYKRPHRVQRETENHALHG